MKNDNFVSVNNGSPVHDLPNMVSWSMAYEVTATRRRPKTFGELAGQEFVSATLSASIQSGQTAHAYLFSGPRGCGKTSAARILAKALNCEKGPAAEPCGECPSCSEISKGSGLDVIEIDGASNTSVNDVRQIKDEVLFPPNASRYKVYIIDEVHMLSTSAFNALLKTIEEPPPYIVFIFATTELHKVPATIKSRCQQFAFKLIPLETIQELLKDACAELNITAEDEALFWIARESTGSLRDAYTLFDQVASFSGGHIRTQLIHEKLGLVGLDNLNILAEACATGDTGAVFKTLDNIIESGVSIEQFTIDLAAYYRSMLLIKCGITKESLLGHSAGRFSQSVLAAYDESRLEEAVRIVLELFRNIRYSISPRFELESAAARLAALENWVSPRELSKTVEHVRAIIQGQWATPGENNTAVGIRQNASNESASNNNGASSDAPSSGTSAPRLSLTASFEQHLATGAPPPQVQSPPEEAAQKASADIPPEVELVRRMFDGEIISS